MSVAWLRSIKFRIKRADLALVVGDVTEYALVEGAVGTRDAVVSALGSGNSLRAYPALIDGVRNIIQAMDHGGVRWIVCLSMLGVGDSRRRLGCIDRYLVVPLLLRNVLADHAKKEALIRQSALDWVIVRPPRLTSGLYTGKYRSREAVRERRPSASISRADVADFVVKRVTDDRYAHATLAVMG